MSLAEEVKASRLPPARVAKAIRESAGVTQRRLAEEVGVHPVTVCRWESQTRTPRGSRRRRYAEVLAALEEATR